jgi:hypothetical protein
MADKIFGKDQEIMLFKTEMDTGRKSHVMTLKKVNKNTIAVYRCLTPLRHLVRIHYGTSRVFTSRKMYLSFDESKVLVHIKGRENKGLTGVYKTNHRRRHGILDKGMKALLPKFLQ